METHEQEIKSKVSTAMSRRNLIVAAATLGLGTVGLPVALDATMRPPVGYGAPDPDHNIIDLTEDTLYPLLAAWLLLTTYHGFAPDTTDAASVARLGYVLNLQRQTVSDILSITGNPQDPTNEFYKVQAKYNLVIQKLTPAGALYSGSHCPSSAASITRISSLAPSLSFLP